MAGRGRGSGGAAAVTRITEARRLPVELASELPADPAGAPAAAASARTGPASVCFEQVRFRHRQDLTGRLPAGLDTQIGHRGTGPSGGEQQRVAIARALLRR